MIWLLLSGPALACEPFNAAEIMDAVARSINEGRPEEGLARMDADWLLVPEACTPVGATDLALMAHRAGSLAWDLAESESSDRWFESACRLAPGATVPASLGPTAAERRRAACARVDAEGYGTVVIEAPVVIDGLRYAADTEMTLPVGEHFVVSEANGGWRGHRQLLTKGSTLGLPSGTIRPAPAAASPSVEPERERGRRNVGAPVALVVAGGVVAGAGGVVLQVLFADRWNRECVGRGYDFTEHGWRECEQERGVPLSGSYYAGSGLVLGGTLLGLTGFGLGIQVLVNHSSAGVTLTIPL